MGEFAKVVVDANFLTTLLQIVKLDGTARHVTSNVDRTVLEFVTEILGDVQTAQLTLRCRIAPVSQSYNT